MLASMLVTYNLELLGDSLVPTPMSAILGASKLGLLWPRNEWGSGSYQAPPVLICFMCMLNYNALERRNLWVETPLWDWATGTLILTWH